jgi:hypothetical protein
MKMDIRNEFKNKGECHFSIKSIDEEFYNYLSEHYKCNEKNNFRDIWHSENSEGFRFDAQIPGGGKEVSLVVDHLPYGELELKKNELVEKYKDWNITQLWYYSRLDDDVVTNGRNNIVKYLYDLDDVEFSDHDQLQLTLYSEHCRFQYHSDGPAAGYMCSVVIYLNENYNVNRGGLFDGDQQYSPEFGMCVVQDLTNYDKRHGVTEVISGERYAILSFPALEGTTVSDY